MKTEASARIGIYGGTFAPPHNGHVAAASAFLREMELDRLYVIPTCRPPHKELHFDDDPELRLSMTKAAFEGMNPRITVSDWEIRRGGRSYTADTLTEFAARGEGELFFLCGTDMFLTLDSWVRPETIFRLATVVCAPRDGENRQELRCRALSYSVRFGARTRILSSEPVVVSSTEVRERLLLGRDVSDLVPAVVGRILRESGAYHE